MTMVSKKLAIILIIMIFISRSNILDLKGSADEAGLNEGNANPSEIALWIHPFLGADKSMECIDMFETTSKNKDVAAKLILTMTRSDNMKMFLERTGFLPPEKSLAGMYGNNLELSKLVQNVQFVKPGLLHPAGRSITTSIIPPVLQAVMSGEDPDTVIDNAVDSINKAVADSMEVKP